jgi:hypothetical protein
MGNLPPLSITYPEWWPEWLKISQQQSPPTSSPSASTTTITATQENPVITKYVDFLLTNKLLTRTEWNYVVDDAINNGYIINMTYEQYVDYYNANNHTNPTFPQQMNNYPPIVKVGTLKSINEDTPLMFTDKDLLGSSYDLDSDQLFVKNIRSNEGSIEATSLEGFRNYGIGIL